MIQHVSTFFFLAIADDHRSSRMIPPKCHTPSNTIKYTNSQNQKDKTSFPQWETMDDLLSIITEFSSFLSFWGLRYYYQNKKVPLSSHVGLSAITNPSSIDLGSLKKWSDDHLCHSAKMVVFPDLDEAF